MCCCCGHCLLFIAPMKAGISRKYNNLYQKWLCQCDTVNHWGQIVTWQLSLSDIQLYEKIMDLKFAHGLNFSAVEL